MEMDGYFGEKFSRPMCWIDLLLLAEWQTEKIFYVRGNKVVVKCGQIAISIEDLSRRWKISKNTVRKRLQEFEINERIIIERSNVVNIITIMNYEKYQGDWGGTQNCIKFDIQNDTQIDTQKSPKNSLFSNGYKDIPQNNDTQTDMQNDLPIKNNKNIYKKNYWRN